MTEFIDLFSEDVWKATYNYNDEQTVDHSFKRVAYAIAQAEKTDELKKIWAALFYDMLTDFKCTAGGRIYANAGTDFGGTTLFNCFTAPRESYAIDSLTNILHTLANQSQTLKSEGGWGENFSYIRPRGSFIKGIGVESPGAIKYMELFDKSSDIITSGSGKAKKSKKGKNKIRKGAQMAIIDCWHPDVLEFITVKQTSGRLTKFNTSVNCSDQFMDRIVQIKEIDNQLKQLETDKDSNNTLISQLQERKQQLDKWDLKFPDTAHPEYDNIWDGNIDNWEKHQLPVVVFNTVSAMSLWNLIMQSTFQRAEPGVLFLDRANANNPGYYFENIIATNPCGEVVLPAGGVCNLGAINLTQYVNEDGEIDYNKLKKYVRILVRFLDNVNDISNFPLEEYKRTALDKRRVGIGVLGWGSLLYMLRIPFGSIKADILRENILKTIYQEAYMASIDLAEEKGMFKYCDPVKHSEGNFVKRLNLPVEYIDKMKKVGIRNSTLGAIAPNGNTSIFANVVSGGLEPVFMPEYTRTVIVSSPPEHIIDVTPKWYQNEWHETEMFKIAMEGDEEILRGVDSNGTVYKIDKNRGLTKEVSCQDYSVRYLKSKGLWDSSADWIKTITNLTVEDHLKDLAGFAKYIDQNCSKTINIPNDYSFDDFQDVYLKAYKSGYIKGLTTYRSGTMTTVLSASEEKNADVFDEEIVLDDVTLPSKGPAQFSTIRAEGKKWYLTTIMDEQDRRPVAFFVHTNAYEKSVTTSDAVDRLIQLAHDKGIPKRWIKDTEDKIKGDNNASKISRCISLNLRHGVLLKNVVSALDNVDGVYVGSFLFQIKKYLMTWIKDGEKVSDGDCAECGSKDSLIYSEGCMICKQCGTSRC